MSEMIEQVAIAQAGARWAEFDEEHKEAARELARLAIEAMRVPTDQMALVDTDPEGATLIWQRMIDDEALR